MSEQMLENLRAAGATDTEVEAVRRFMHGEKPGATSNIAEQIVYGYGEINSNGLWQHQIPDMFNDIVKARLQTVCIADVIINLKSIHDYWSQTKKMPSGEEQEVARAYQVRWNKKKQAEDLLELPQGWQRTFCPTQNLYVIDYNPKHVLRILTLQDAIEHMALIGCKELIEKQSRWPAANKYGFQLVGAVPTGKHGQLQLLILAKTFEMKVSRDHRPSMKGRRDAARSNKTA